MNGFYEWAKSVVNNANTQLDGGVFAVFLRNVNLNKTAVQKKDEFSVDKVINDVSNHAVSVLSKGGYAAAIACTVCWIMLLLVGIVILWKLRYKATKVEANGNGYGGKKSSGKKNPLIKARNNCQTKAVGVILVIILVCTPLLILAGLLGIASTVDLQVNFVQKYKYDNRSALIPSHNLEEMSNSETAINPRLVHAVSSLKSYLDNFVDDTLAFSKPVVDSLINATLSTQDKSSREFTDELQNILGTAEIGQLSEKILQLSLVTLNIFTEMKRINKEFMKNTKQLSVLKRDWGQAFDEVKPANCTGDCKDAFDEIIHRIHVARNTNILPPDVDTFHRMISKQDPKNKLGKAERIAEEQRMETMKEMSKLIDIPGSVKNQSNGKWEKMRPMLHELSAKIETLAPAKLNQVASATAKVGNYILALNCFIWTLSLCLIVFLSWMVYQYVATGSKMSVTCRRNVRTFGCIGLTIIIVFLLFACLLFFASGYAYTEGCRYFDAHRSIVVGSDGDKKFAIDVHINNFLIDNWSIIEKMAEENAKKNNETAQLLPKVRDIIMGLSVKCKDNVGVLQAFDAIESYDILSTYDDSFTKHLLKVGKQVLAKSVKNLDLDTMISPKEESDLGQVGNLDFNYTLKTVQIPIFEIMNSENEPVKKSWDSVQQDHTVALKYVKDRRKVQSVFNRMKAVVHKLSLYVEQMTDKIKMINARERLGPIGKRLIENIKTFRKKMSEERDRVIEIAKTRYDEVVGRSARSNGERLILTYGPKVMGSVGRCKKLYDAFNDVNQGVCNGIIGPLNGLWFCAGCCSLFGTIVITIAMIFLLKPRQILKPSENGKITNDLQENVILTTDKEL